MICAFHGFLGCRECPSNLKENTVRCKSHRINNCTQAACRRERERRNTQNGTPDSGWTYDTFSTTYSDTGSSGSPSGSSDSGSSGSSSCGE